MIKLIVGKKGSGKTKALINFSNQAVESSKGKVVCVEKGTHLMHEISSQARLVNIEDYVVDSYPVLYGFVAGILAGNYDITDLFIDGTTRTCGSNYAELATIIQKISKLIAQNDVNIVFTLSCDKSELPEALLKYIITH